MWFQYDQGGEMVLRDISLTVRKGEVVAFVGLSGAGKSTLLALLGTLAAASDGSFAIAGHEAAGDAAALRRSIGVLAHSPMVYEELTPLENLRFFARLYGVADGEDDGVQYQASFAPAQPLSPA